MTMTIEYVISYTEMQNGIITNAGCFDKAEKTYSEASAKMVKDYEDTLEMIKSCSSYPEKIDAEITEDEVEGVDLPVLCVIRDFNGTDNDIYTWAVWPVEV